MSKPIKVHLWIRICNSGDGSAYARFFKSQEEAEKDAEGDNERFCDDIYDKYFEVDFNGNILNLD